jgi:tRNA C32,U32 (ribose-2'-O)-methylase TrmJ
MVRNIRNIFQRNRLTDQELRTLHGILSAFDPARGKGKGEG